MATELTEDQQEALETFAAAAAELRQTRTRSRELQQELEVYQQEKVTLDQQRATQQQEAEKASRAFILAMLPTEEGQAARPAARPAVPVRR